MGWFRCLVGAVATCLALAGHAHAGPVELFRSTLQNPESPDDILLHYIYGGSGLFVSHDAAKTFKLMPFGAMNQALVADDDAITHLGPNTLYIGKFTGLWRSDANGCNVSEVPELDGKYIGGFSGDPVDPKRTYLVTTNGQDASGNWQKNGIWLNDGDSPAWTQIGPLEEQFINSIDVVKTAEGRRIYETVVRLTVSPDMTSVTTQYLTRHSDDDGETWVEFEFDQSLDNVGEFKVLSVNPNNSDEVVGLVYRDGSPDQLYASAQQGKPGSWQRLAELQDCKAAEFTPDGKLYFGDFDQAGQSLYMVDKFGAEPKKLEKTWKVGCLKWDAPRERMLGCNDWLFGSVDLTTGEFTTLFDMRVATQFAECSGQPPTHETAKVQLLGGYCGDGHYPQAPLCDVYYPPGTTYRPGGGGAGAALGGTGASAGMSGFGASGSGGVSTSAAGAGAVSGSTSAAGSGAGGQGGAATVGDTPKDSGGGCTVAAPQARSSGAGAVLSVLGLALVAFADRRRRPRGVA